MATPDYALLERQVRALVSGEPDHLANAANFAAFVFAEIPDVSWVGFYYPDGSGDLVLGPFQGRPACTRLPKGRGVCGAAFARKETVVVDDVNSFADHIICDVDARSEMVVPLLANDGAAYGVFDLDSARPGRFVCADHGGIARLVFAFTASTSPKPLP